MKIIATSSTGSGFLPMKQNKELEDKKSERQKRVELCNFLKNAFCVDGLVSLTDGIIEVDVLGDKKTTGAVFVAEDKTRGKFFVSFGKID